MQGEKTKKTVFQECVTWPSDKNATGPTGGSCDFMIPGFKASGLANTCYLLFIFPPFKTLTILFTCCI